MLIYLLIGLALGFIVGFICGSYMQNERKNWGIGNSEWTKKAYEDRNEKSPL